MIIPKRLEILPRYAPWTNIAIIAVTVATFLAQYGAPGDITSHLLLHRGFDFGLIGHMLAHADMLHLLGNMIFLWAFGNALCCTLGTIRYSVLYLGLGLVSGFGHLIVSDDPAIGASGAICGVVGVVLALFPLNRVHFTWIFGVAYLRDFAWPAWWLGAVWIAFDLYGAITGGGNIAYGAHLAGYASGICLGLYLLHAGKVRLTLYDNPSLLEKITGKTLPRVDPDDVGAV